MPLAPPVTSAILPSSLSIGCLLSSFGFSFAESFEGNRPTLPAHVNRSRAIRSGAVRVSKRRTIRRGRIEPVWDLPNPVLIALLVAVFLLAGWAAWEVTSLVIEE